MFCSFQLSARTKEPGSRTGLAPGRRKREKPAANATGSYAGFPCFSLLRPEEPSEQGGEEEGEADGEEVGDVGRVAPVDLEDAGEAGADREGGDPAVPRRARAVPGVGDALREQERGEGEQAAEDGISKEEDHIGGVDAVAEVLVDDGEKDAEEGDARVDRDEAGGAFLPFRIRSIQCR